MAITLALALLAGLAVVWVRVVETLKEPAPTGQPHALGEPGGLVWDGRVFTSPAQLMAYLGPKTYRRWAARHPTAFGALAVVTHTPTKTATRTHRTKPARTVRTAKAVETVRTTAVPAKSTTGSQSFLARSLTLLLILVGLALGASAVVPYRVAPVPLRRLYAQPDRRLIALAAATAMVLGFGVAFYLG